MSKENTTLRKTEFGVLFGRSDVL